jgi:hypothetical protein
MRFVRLGTGKYVSIGNQPVGDERLSSGQNLIERSGKHHHIGDRLSELLVHADNLRLSAMQLIGSQVGLHEIDHVIFQFKTEQGVNDNSWVAPVIMKCNFWNKSAIPPLS